MAITYTPQNQAPQQPMPQPQAYQQQPVMPTPNQTADGRVIPDCLALDSQTMKNLKNSYRASAAANEIVLVDGVVRFCHITRRIEGEALREENSRRKNLGRLMSQNPYVDCPITNASVRFADPANPTNAELLVASCFYKNKDGEACYTAEASFYPNSKQQMPYIGLKNTDDPADASYIQVYPKEEPVNGTPVTLVLHTYENRHQGGTSIGFNGVLVNTHDDSVFGYGAGGIRRDVEALRARGILLTPTAQKDPLYDPESEEGQLIANGTASMANDFGVQPTAEPVVPVYQPQPQMPAPADYQQPYQQPAAPVTPFFPQGGQSIVQ